MALEIGAFAVLEDLRFSRRGALWAHNSLSNWHSREEFLDNNIELGNEL
jgi:hypothetical protein